jgi:hypothetical protein
MLPPGSYQLRASVTSTRLEKGGSVYLAIDVPDFTTVPLAVSGLIVGPYGSPRVPVAETPVQLPFVPSVDREFFSTDTLRVYFEIASKRPERDDSGEGRDRRRRRQNRQVGVAIAGAGRILASSISRCRSRACPPARTSCA